MRILCQRRINIKLDIYSLKMMPETGEGTVAYAPRLREKHMNASFVILMMNEH